MRTSRRRAGLSLVELPVAMGILSFGVVGVVRALALATRYNHGAESETTAGLLAQDMLEELRGDDTIAEGANSGAFDGDQSKFSWARTVPKTDKDHLYRVEVTVSWPGAGRHRDLTLTTLVYRNE